MDNSLILGIVLIGVGMALALIAYAVMLNRREPEPEAPPAEPKVEGMDQVLEPQEAAEPIPTMPPPPWAEKPAAAAPSAPSPEPAPAAPPLPKPAVQGEMGRRLFPVAFLLREDASGALVVQVGERLYRKPEDLKISPDWARVESVSAELARWTAVERPAARPSVPPRDEAPTKAGSMIEQINEILEKKLEASGNLPRGVRLAEGPGATVRVYVGVQAYSIEEVPDPSIRQLIRQAVAEWEASR
ncbi:MAG TPA: hypothetical protein VFI11_10885 [Anaerolineales bacterium]|nr:hypothetical protein [Anaerolineales bacterium]